MWGENSFNMRLRKPKGFHHFKGGLKQIALGKRHGIALDNQGTVYVWGDGTYGELGM
jgi:alpha-tubulin suppressor-like RCC1 family protein